MRARVLARSGTHCQAPMGENGRHQAQAGNTVTGPALLAGDRGPSNCCSSWAVSAAEVSSRLRACSTSPWQCSWLRRMGGTGWGYRHFSRGAAVAYRRL